ncbi:MAG: extracellular solute-binding protein [Candidatus Acidiferrales bacterium]
MLATAARFTETHPDVRIEWEARSLQGFADQPIRDLAEEFDLLVLDHPFMGAVAKGAYLVPLDDYISPEVLSNLRSESVGASHQSYFYQGHQWALAIDAAAQVAGYRPDLLAAAGVTVPSTWEEVSELARIGRGFVTTPLLPVDSFCSFLTLCASSGEAPFAPGSHKVAAEKIGESALHQLKTLLDFAAKDARELNPIAVWERMSTTDEIAYCPLAFGYSNYARPGYRRAPVHFTNIPSRPPRGPAGSVLGGAGLAISARCRELSAAVDYALWVASAECQKTIYVHSGGQPGNRKAWIDPGINAMSNHYFEATLPTVEHAFLRPRFAGFVVFQSHASSLISNFLLGKYSSAATLDSLDEWFRKATS